MPVHVLPFATTFSIIPGFIYQIDVGRFKQFHWETGDGKTKISLLLVLGLLLLLLTHSYSRQNNIRPFCGYVLSGEAKNSVPR